ncbi:MAG TPA: AraC family transcriptional regulator [Planctomycetota bacterium]|nr:AraC family transcriptional regulator [Planctomycetota bacterium]
MLRYVGSGVRRYAEVPVAPNPRTAWEFQAATAGRIAPTATDGTHPPPRGRRLWVFPPGHRHGWTGDTRAARVAVFHFDAVPEPLRTVVIARGALALDLDPLEAARLDALAVELAPHVAQVGPLTALVEQRALLDLCLIALGHVAPTSLPRPAAAPRRLVEAALAWYGEHLGEGPGVTEVARAVGVSVAHLRRLFQAAQHRSPLAAMREARVQRADDLIRAGDLRLEHVARVCGYADGAAFSRAFKSIRGSPPSRWRRRPA